MKLCRNAHLLVFAALLPVAACRTDSATVDAVEATATNAPMDVDGAHDSPWEYLVAEYDADGDGAISAAEHGRGDESFRRLDQNGDDVITAADFDGERDVIRAMMMLALYFQADGERLELAAAELPDAVAAYDRDGDRGVDGEELAASREARAAHGIPLNDGMRRTLERMDPWKTLTEAADQDADGVLAEADLLAFFRANDPEGSEVWDLRPFLGRGHGRSADAHDGLAAQLGQPAPDFTLSSDDGEERVTLSDFVDDQPVALIFGSYT